jgi:hypothetical protein
MTTDGGATTRTFAATSLKGDDVARLSEVYDARPERDAETGGSKFAGTFGEVLPTELGNRNGLSEISTRLGTTRFYYEAFAEQTDEWAALKRRIDAGELWVRLFGRWAEKGIDDSSKREEWRSYVDGTLVPLSTKLALQWGASATSTQAIRVGQRVRTADERGVVTPEERLMRRFALPILLEIADREMLTPQESHRFFLIGVDANATKAERDWVVDEVGKPALLRLVRRFRPETRSIDDVNFSTMAFGFYLWANTSSERNDLLLASPVISAEDKAKIRAAQERGGTQGGRAAPAAVLVSIPPPFGVEPLSKPKATEADVRLRTGERPFVTNGDWDEETKTVVFSSSFVAAERRTTIAPAVYFAAWSEPDTAVQVKLFGRVIASGEELAAYAIWVESVGKERRLRWDRLLDRLEQEGPSLGVRESIVGFRDEVSVDAPLPGAIDRWITDLSASGSVASGR